MSGKRANIFSQGRPERPYDERDEDDVDPPRQATAAQLATRKIKTAKPRRGAAGASTPLQSASLGAPSSFGFGASAPAVGGQGGMFGATSNTFGGAATNSFPPAQPTAPSNAFSASSFPAFGATGQSTGFNPQPPTTASFNPQPTTASFNPQPTTASFNPQPTTASFNPQPTTASFNPQPTTASFNPQPPTTADFNFAGSSANPFAANNTPAMNGNGNSTPAAFGGGSVFSSQAPNNPFGCLSQPNFSSAAPSDNMFSSAAPSDNMFSSAAPSNNMFSSAAPSNNMFSSAAPSNNMFSSAAPSDNMFSSAAPSNNMFSTSTSNANATSSPAPFSFSGVSSSAQPSSTPAPSNPFGGFGGAQNNAAPAQNGLFSNFGANAQNESATQQQAPQNSLSNAGTSAQGAQSTTATAPSNNLFGFGATQPNASASSAAPPSNMFATTGTPSAAPAVHPFAQLPTAAASSTPSFTFGQQTPQAQEKPSSNPFGAIKLPKDAAATPKPALSSSLNDSKQPTAAPSEIRKPNLLASLAKSKSKPAANTSGFSIFGAAQNKDTNSQVSNKFTAALTDKTSQAVKPNFSSGFRTPQPAKTADAEKTKAGMFTAQPKPTGNGIFAHTFQPETSNASNAFKSAPKFPAFKPQTTKAEALKETASTPAKDASDPFSSLPAPSSQQPNLFAPQKEQAPTPSSSSMPTLTSSATSSSEATSGPELPKIPKAHVPKEWNASMAPTSQETGSLFKVITNLTVQLQQLNERYRSKLSTLSPSADWSALSLWHHQHSSAIKTKIDVAKKQRAAEKGITGKESALSTKRKVNDESPESRDASPTKRARPTETPATPTPQSTNPPPKPNPPATATSNLFAKAINSKPSAPVEQSNVTAAKTTDTQTPSSTLAQVPGFRPFSGVATPISLGGFQFNGGSASSQAPPSSGPAFKPVTSSSTGGFASQFAATAKTFEQLAAERKKKAMDADYDSDEETKEEWSARYDKQEAERIAKEKAAAAAAPAFSLPAFGKTPDATTSKTATSTGQAKPASGASTPAGLSGSRPASPALSTTGSVFDAPSTAQTPSSNIFGHLSSGASSNNQGESEDDGEQGTETSKNNPTTPPKRKFSASADEATESHDEEVKRQKQSTSSKGSLLSRMTRTADDGSESEKENNSKTNGTHTPTNKPFAFFDFNAAAGPNSAPAKSDAFTGDQTFKPGTPIKFGDVAATEKKAPPTFQFQAPSSSTTPSKPPPSNLFGSSLLAANSGLSGLGSAPSSTFSSRAATPLSEAEGSAASAAEDDDEGGKQDQVDLSKLTSEEAAANDVVFETEQALAKHQVDQGDGTKAWENFARGPLYILKDKVTGKCFIRIRIPSGQTPLNYSILPALKSQVTGSSGKMVQATMPKKEGGFAQFFISLKTKELAKEFSAKYNASLPS